MVFCSKIRNIHFYYTSSHLFLLASARDKIERNVVFLFLCIEFLKNVFSHCKLATYRKEKTSRNLHSYLSNVQTKAVFNIKIKPISFKMSCSKGFKNTSTNKNVTHCQKVSDFKNSISTVLFYAIRKGKANAQINTVSVTVELLSVCYHKVNI